MAVAEFRALVGSMIFGATFRRADGTLRTGAFRLDVRKDLTGAGLAYDPDERGVVTVWDMRLGAYRSIKLSRLMRVRVRGVEVIVDEEAA